MDEDTIFTKIIKGEVPSFKVYEDEFSYAFMDIHPIQPGHVLVVSKKQVATFEQLTDEDFSNLMLAVKKVALKIKQELKPRRVGIIIEGFEVEHAHVKVLPINSEQELRHLPSPDEHPSAGELEAMARRLALSA